MKCKKHGEHDAIMTIHFHKEQTDFSYCMYCWKEKLDEIGVCQMTAEPTVDGSK